MRVSIRWRLMFWNALAFAFVLVGFAALVYGLSARALYQQTDQRLSSALERLSGDPRVATDTAGRLRYWAFELHEHENIYCIVYDQSGTVRERTPELASDSVLPAPTAPQNTPQIRSQNVPILGRQRLLETKVQLGGQDLVIALMTSLSDVDRELGRLLHVLFFAIPGALIASAVLGYFLARKALAPVEQLRRTTREISAERLSRRLPVTNPGDELGALAVTINEMLERLERSFTEIRRFTADASHELRTPLTAIRTEAELALSKHPGPADQHLLGSILEECQRLTRLTDQLLTLSREDAGVTTQADEALDLAALAAGVVENMRPLAEAKGVALTARLARTATVRGDAARLRQVLYNLLDNAVKYTPEKGRAEVAVEARGSSAVLTVADTGEGIAPEHVPHIFERFYRVDKARTRAEGGTGLGLSIARSIVTAHGGTIDVASTLGKGTVFTVVLPLDSERNGKSS
jgi:heavy metal sensor kinase